MGVLLHIVGTLGIISTCSVAEAVSGNVTDLPMCIGMPNPIPYDPATQMCCTAYKSRAVCPKSSSCHCSPPTNAPPMCSGGGIVCGPPKCNVAQRIDCGFSGIDQEQCEAKGCCFSAVEQWSDEPWCFKPAETPSNDDDLINEFNDPRMGIAFTMIPQNVWEMNGKGNNGMDAAGFFRLDEMSEYHRDKQQAMSIVTREQDMNPYDGGYGTHGLAFHITENRQFWKYFQNIGHGQDGLVAGPGDGGSHTPGTADWRITLYSSGKSYDWFTQKKNAILAEYNTVYHIHDYNEFDTNGLSPEGLAGVFLNEQKTSPGPSSTTMCKFLMHANPSRSSWPVYAYVWHKLYIKEVLHCAGYAATSNVSNVIV